MGAPNILAHLALLLWIPLGLVICGLVRPTVAALLILFGGTMFLPEKLAFDFPVVPPLDKHVIASLALLLGCLISKPHVILRRQTTSAASWLFVLLTVSTIATVFSNRDPLRYGPLVVAGLTNYDILSTGINVLLHITLPFFLGQTLFRNFADLRDLVLGLVWTGLIYSPLILLEARLSPQLHTWTYGYFQHDFQQAIRSGGFRPFVFMGHGLAVAIFIATSVIAATTLPKIRQTAFRLPRVTLGYLTVLLVFCKSMGAILYAAFILPLMAWTKPQTRMRWASWLAFFVLSYPLARFFGLISTQSFIDLAAQASEERSLSLRFRFVNEDLLLQKAQQRLWFGWGGWGRGRIYDLWGNDISVTDGEWIIQLGDGGAFGFLITVGCFLAPIFVAKKALARGTLTAEDGQLLTALALIIAITGIDLIPNSMWTTLPYFMAGALGSVSAHALRGRAETAASLQTPPARGPAHHETGTAAP